MGRRSRSRTRSRGGTLKIVAVLSLCALSFLLHAWLRTQVVTMSYEVSSVRKQKLALESDLLKLKVKKAQLIHPNNVSEYVEALEGSEKKFRRAKPEQIIFLRHEDESGELF